MEKNLTFAEKINIILKIKGIKIKELENQWGKSGTLYKAYDENREFSDRLRDEFLQKFSIKKSWWMNPVGTSEAAVFEENHTSVIESIDNHEKNEAESIYRDLVEANSDYRLVPKTVLEGEYRMMLKSEIDSKEKMLWQVIDAKNYAIAQLEREIAELRAGKRVVHPQNA